MFSCAQTYMNKTFLSNAFHILFTNPSFPLSNKYIYIFLKQFSKTVNVFLSLEVCHTVLSCLGAEKESNIWCPSIQGIHLLYNMQPYCIGLKCAFVFPMCNQSQIQSKKHCQRITFYQFNSINNKDLGISRKSVQFLGRLKTESEDCVACSGSSLRTSSTSVQVPEFSASRRVCNCSLSKLYVGV